MPEVGSKLGYQHGPEMPLMALGAPDILMEQNEPYQVRGKFNAGDRSDPRHLDESLTLLGASFFLSLSLPPPPPPPPPPSCSFSRLVPPVPVPDGRRQS